MPKTALASLYGRPPLAGNVGKKKREQEIWTPIWIIEAATKALGGRIDLDPCAASKPAAWFAGVNITLPDNSLVVPWAAGAKTAYMNPPFADLEIWLTKARMEVLSGLKIVGLFPFRPHRNWFFPLTREATLVALWYDVKFQGHKSAFPAPLVMASWNCEIPDLGKRETGRIMPGSIGFRQGT